MNQILNKEVHVAGTKRARMNLHAMNKKISHRNIHVEKSTFKGGLDTPFHRWFRLTPSFGPELVQHVLEQSKSDENTVVLDPFSGAGTTPIECMLKGIPSFGFEINPFLHFVASTSTNVKIDVPILKNVLEKIVVEYKKSVSQKKDIQLENTKLKIPTIHNVYRWWRADILKQILILKDSIDKNSSSDVIRSFFRLTLAGVLVPDLTNVTLGRLQLHFIDKSDIKFDVLNTFLKHALKMIDDLLENQEAIKRSSIPKIYLTNSTTPKIKNGPKANLVITSPPYPNRYSYVWNTRPHLYMLDFFEGKVEASKLDKETIGGTWGTATSILMKGEVEPEYEIIRDVVSPITDQIRKEDNLMANYVMKYFNMLAKQIEAMSPFLQKRSQVAYVIGNSRIKDTYVETDLILGKIFEGLGLGYQTTNIERFRKRNSGVDLYETIVFATKS